MLRATKLQIFSESSTEKETTAARLLLVAFISSKTAGRQPPMAQHLSNEVGALRDCKWKKCANWWKWKNQRSN